MHHPSSGQPYTSDQDGLGEFAPKGDPEKLNLESGTKPDTEAEVSAALAEFAPLTGAKKFSSLTGPQKIDVPKEGEASLHNRKV